LLTKKKKKSIILVLELKDGHKIIPNKIDRVIAPHLNRGLATRPPRYHNKRNGCATTSIYIDGDGYGAPVCTNDGGMQPSSLLESTFFKKIIFVVQKKA
jgi:hypothetical protein